MRCCGVAFLNSDVSESKGGRAASWRNARLRIGTLYANVLAAVVLETWGWRNFSCMRGGKGIVFADKLRRSMA